MDAGLPIPKKRKRTHKGRMKGARALFVRMSPELWALVEKLRVIIDERQKTTGRPKTSRSTVAQAILIHSLQEHGLDIQAEYRELGLHGLAVQLAPAFGADGLTAAGLPPVEHPRRRLPRHIRIPIL